MPSPKWTFEPQHDVARTISAEPLVGDERWISLQTRDILLVFFFDQHYPPAEYVGIVAL